MELTTVIIGIIIIAIALLLYFNRGAKNLDVNNDGKVDAADVKAAVANVEAGVKRSAVRVKTQAKKTAAKAKTAVKKTTTTTAKK
jgi:topoisomerase IA-like protein